MDKNARTDRATLSRGGGGGGVGGGRGGGEAARQASPRSTPVDPNAQNLQNRCIRSARELSFSQSIIFKTNTNL